MAADLQLDIMTRPAWHALSPEEALQAIKSREEGLNQEEVRQRQEQFGPNKLPEKKRAGLALVFLRQFKSPLIYVLLIAGMVSLAIDHQKDAIFIFAVLLINSVIGTIQEWKAESSAQALQHAIKTIANIRRSGQRQEIDSIELVPGDILVLESGEAIPADLRLLSAKGLRVDESLLTGESDPVQKNPQADLAGETPLAERQTLLHAGTAVVDGRATAVVCRIGAATEVGRIAQSLEKEAAAPPLVIRLEQFSRAIAYVVLAVVGVLSAVQLSQGAEWSQVFLLAVALAVSAIPEGLPVAITVALSIGTQRMAQRHVIIRQLPAVEGLGACTLIASDKTGTLTANKLTVKRIMLRNSEMVTVGGEGLQTEGDMTLDGQAVTDDNTQQSLRRLVLSGMLCNEGEFAILKDGQIRQAGDAVDVAFLVLAAKYGLQQEPGQKNDHPQTGFIPFESQRRYAASFNREQENFVVHVKGAAETVLPMCRGIDKDMVMAQQESLAGDGYRVLAVASGEVEKDQAEAEDEGALHNLDFLGLVGIIDPIRPEIPEAIERCHRAGVKICMITGDHPSTGRAIAKQLGLRSDEEAVLTGADFTKLENDEEALTRKVRETSVFARVEPGQKTTIVKVLQRLKHFVAVTGDGVNDAPALKAANIGVAMGQSGTDVARRAADLILTDDNFASIVNGIEEGRIAYSNVRKVTWLLISTGAAEVVLFFFSLLSGLSLPLDAVQLLWLNLITNGVQDVALAFEKGESGLLDRSPRPPDQPIFDRLMIEETVVSGVCMGLVAFGTFYWLFHYTGFSEFEARNLLLLLMVLFENIHVFNCRSESRSFYEIPLRANPLLIIAVVIAQGVHVLAMHIPVLSSILEIQPVDPVNWVMLLGMALTILLVMEIYKHLRGQELARTWR